MIWLTNAPKARVFEYRECIYWPEVFTGRPQASREMSVAQLEAHGMVGLYRPEPHHHMNGKEGEPI